MPKEKFYAVCGGPKPGVYETWDEAKQHCIGIKACAEFAAPKYRTFSSAKKS